MTMVGFKRLMRGPRSRGAISALAVAVVVFVVVGIAVEVTFLPKASNPNSTAEMWVA